jgi:hypothetical protein
MTLSICAGERNRPNAFSTRLLSSRLKIIGTGPFHPRWSLLKIALAPFDRRPISEPFMLHLSVAKLGKWQWVSRCTGRYFLLSP